MVQTIAVSSLLDGYGWKYGPIEQGLLTGFVGADGSLYGVTILPSEAVTSLTVSLEVDTLFVNEETLTLLLNLNAQLAWVKVGVVPDADILIVGVDCPNDGLNESTLAQAIDLLSETAQMVTAAFPGLIRQPKRGSGTDAS